MTAVRVDSTNWSTGKRIVVIGATGGAAGGTRSALDAGDIASAKDVGTATVRSADTGELVVFDLPFWFSVAAFASDAKIIIS